MFYDGHFVYNTYGELPDNIDLLHDIGISRIPGMNKNNIEEYITHHFVLFLKEKGIDRFSEMLLNGYKE